MMEEQRKSTVSAESAPINTSDKPKKKDGDTGNGTDDDEPSTYPY